MNVVEQIHGAYVAGRRARVIAARLAEMMPPTASVLDVGCGDGEIAWLVGQARPDLCVQGVDVLVRPETRIPVAGFDGRTLPYPDNSFDVVSLIDVLHHCNNPAAILREAQRVARRAILIKDHSLEGFAAKQTLRLMDWVGNHRYGVALPYNYLRPEHWSDLFDSLGLKLELRVRQLGLYPWPLAWAFDRRLHFVARLALPTEAQTAPLPQPPRVVAVV